MTFYIYSPEWFSGFDSLLEITIILTSLVISYYSYRAYRLFEFKKYKYFSVTFILFSIAFISKIISNLIFILPIKKQIILPYLTYTYISYIKLNYIEDIAFLIHKIALLLSLIILFFIINKEKNLENIFLTSILIILLGFLIKNYIIFHFLLILIVSYIAFISIFKDIKRKNPVYNKNIDKVNNNIKEYNLIKNIITFTNRISLISKLLIGLNISFILSFLAIENDNFYIFGELLISLTFLYILFKIIKIFKFKK